jgi:hypothetical protein
MTGCVWSRTTHLIKQTSLSRTGACLAARDRQPFGGLSIMTKNKKWMQFPHAEYHAWYSMVRRCHNPRDANFARYGGRGIHVCDRWRNNFRAFLADMGLRPTPDHSLDRRDNDAGYTPENCRWATRSVQQRNREVVVRAGGATRAGNRWRAQIQVNGRRVILGHFETKAEASRVYRQAALQAFIMSEVVAAATDPLTRYDRCANCGFAGRHSPPPQRSFNPLRYGPLPAGPRRPPR